MKKNYNIFDNYVPLSGMLKLSKVILMKCPISTVMLHWQNSLSMRGDCDISIFPHLYVKNLLVWQPDSPIPRPHSVRLNQCRYSLFF